MGRWRLTRKGILKSNLPIGVQNVTLKIYRFKNNNLMENFKVRGVILEA